MLWLGMVAWILFVVAAARPQWLGESIELPISGRDLMIAVDLSGSMEINDFVISDRQVDRLTATKLVAGDFIDRRVGDRLGLVLFGRQAYLQTPLTFDRETVKTLLYESVIGLAGKETAIGDAIGLAVKRLREVKNQESAAKSDEKNNVNLSDKILILLTDGANTAGEVEPIKAAEMAAEMGLKIYTIGIGADEMLVRSFFGMRKVNPSTDLDEDTLKKIAQVTGGKYFRARDTQELEKIYELLDELEPITKETQYFRPTSALFMWPLGLAMALATILVLIRLKR
jgi:Ca-activated chloride channel family protein